VISHPKRLESGGGGVDPEGEAAGRQGAARFCWGRKERREEEEGAGGPGVIK
jgi:hypothetical protein